MLHITLAALSTLFLMVELSCGQSTAGGVRPVEPDYNGRCEKLTVSFCANIRVENTVYLPNSRGHDTQEAAFKELDDYFPLLTNSSCSNGLYHFLCSYYFPLCYSDPLSNKPTKLEPCRSLCEYVRPPCEATLVAYNLSWPAFLNCSLGSFASDGDTCFGPPDPSTAIFTTVGERDRSSAMMNSITILSTLYGAAIALYNTIFWECIHYWNPQSVLILYHCCHGYSLASSHYTYNIIDKYLLLLWALW